MTKLARRVISSIPLVADRLRGAGRRRPLIRGGIVISTSMVCATTLALFTSPRLGVSQVRPACQLPKNAVVISEANAAQAGAEIHMEEDPGNSKVVDGTLHLYLRNEGLTQPDQLCASAHLTDTKGAPRAVLMALSPLGREKSAPDFEENTSCLKIDPPWGAFQGIPFDLHLQVQSTFIPLSGSINLNSNAISKEPSAPGIAEQKADGSHDCASSSKLLTRSVMLLPSISSWWLELPLIGAPAIALGYLLISWGVLRKSLRKPVPAPQWNFASFASNFTIGTGLLTPLLGANVITDALHYMTKFHYALLSILFAGLLLLAPAIFSFFSIPRERLTPSGQTSTVSVGSVGLFLVTAALMICAVLGQLITLGLAIAEVQFRGYIGSAPYDIMLFLLLVAGIGTIVSAVMTGSYLGKTESATPTVEHLKTTGETIKSLSPEKAFGSASSKVFTSDEQRTLEYLMGEPNTELRTWKMF